MLTNRKPLMYSFSAEREAVTLGAFLSLLCVSFDLHPPTPADIATAYESSNTSLRLPQGSLFRVPGKTNNLLL
jgi:hypothetical protein